MNLSNLPKVATEKVSKLTDRKNDDQKLVFDGSTKIKTEVYKEEKLLTAPLSGTPCVSYEVKAYNETSQANYHIGTVSSEAPFYVLIEETLVERGIVHFDFAPTFKKTYKSGEEPEEIKAGMTTLGWLEEAQGYPEYTLEEWVLVPQHPYSLTIEELGYAIPPKKPGGEPIYGYGYHFHFK